ncbi:YcxB family protein [Herbivorax sp. ANBcel31]|uniref:YcxB family protein n=1 Tax=Herbivorax sp. ANBcel31 TaxID=3069754 RepID=UPI0027AEFC61|nr:YcxB family protein [Herbivorax sp. ANBcel31]MDQ2087963.1 YcxB family protein [Herbivorax sp. ANBcel31]
MEKVVEVEIRYSDKDIKQALSYLILQLNMFWICLISCPIIVVGIFLYGLIYGFSNNTNGLIISFLVLSVIIYIVYYYLPISRYLDFYRKRNGGTYIFSSKQIESIGKEVQSIFNWSVFKKAYDIPTAFLLADENEFLYIFPKNLFENSKDILTMQQLISENIENYKWIR